MWFLIFSTFLVEACLGLLSVAGVLSIVIKTLMLGRKAWGKETYEGEYEGYHPLLFSILFQFFLSISLPLVNYAFGRQFMGIITGILDRKSWTTTLKNTQKLLSNKYSPTKCFLAVKVQVANKTNSTNEFLHQKMIINAKYRRTRINNFFISLLWL